MKKFIMLVFAIILIFSNAIIAEAEDTNPFIKQGDYGPEVIELHQKLIELGLFGLRAESPYGPESIEAVKLLQNVLGLDETGTVENPYELNLLMSATIDPQINLATGTEEEKTVAPKDSNNWCSPGNLYPTSALGLALLKNVKTFIVSFDWKAEDADTAIDASISLKYTESSYKAAGYFSVPIGDSSGHCEVEFEPIDEMREYGTGWLISGVGKETNRNIKITLSNFKFTLAP